VYVSLQSSQLQTANANIKQATFAPTAVASATVVHELQANSEWRFEVAFGKSIELKVRK
jgi:hypothetical protein